MTETYLARTGTRRSSHAAAATVAGLAMLTACGGVDRGPVCTLKGAVPGIGVKFAPDVVSRVAEATLTACWDGTCRRHAVQLSGHVPSPRPATPGNPVLTTETAPSTDPPNTDVPSAEPGSTSQPTDRRTGFARVPGLPTKPVRVTLVLKDERGTTLLDEQTRVTPKPSYPNGRDCPADKPQAHLTVSGMGSLSPR